MPAISNPRCTPRLPIGSSGARTRPPGTGGEPKRSGRAAFRAPLPRLVLLDVVPDELQQYSGHGLALGCRDRLEPGVEFHLHVEVHLLDSVLHGDAHLRAAGKDAQNCDMLTTS